MNWKRYIPDHAVTTIPVLAVMVGVHFFLLRDEPVEPGIEANAVPMFYQPWKPPADQAEFDIDSTSTAKWRVLNLTTSSATTRYATSCINGNSHRRAPCYWK
jgi:hypothetical protein